MNDGLRVRQGYLAFRRGRLLRRCGWSGVGEASGSAPRRRRRRSRRCRRTRRASSSLSAAWSATPRPRPAAAPVSGSSGAGPRTAAATCPRIAATLPLCLAGGGPDRCDCCVLADGQVAPRPKNLAGYGLSPFADPPPSLHIMGAKDEMIQPVRPSAPLPVLALVSVRAASADPIVAAGGGQAVGCSVRGERGVDALRQAFRAAEYRSVQARRRVPGTALPWLARSCWRWHCCTVVYWGECDAFCFAAQQVYRESDGGLSLRCIGPRLLAHLMQALRTFLSMSSLLSTSTSSTSYSFGHFLPLPQRPATMHSEQGSCCARGG